MMSKKTVSPSLENYLETMWFLFEKNGCVRLTDVAFAMNISKPSVNKAINVLKKGGYVNHEHYGLLTLTETGLHLAKSVALRHVTLKRFLKEILMVEEETAELEACKMEHVMSPETIEKLTLYLDKKLL